VYFFAASEVAEAIREKNVSMLTRVCCVFLINILVFPVGLKRLVKF